MLSHFHGVSSFQMGGGLFLTRPGVVSCAHDMAERGRGVLRRLSASASSRAEEGREREAELISMDYNLTMAAGRAASGQPQGVVTACTI